MTVIALSDDDRLRRDVIERVMRDLEIDIAAERGADPAPLKAAASYGMLRFEEDGLAISISPGRETVRATRAQ